MVRLLFPEGKQHQFLDKLISEENISVGDLAKTCGVSGRTIRDWRKEKFKVSEKALLQIKKRFKIDVPCNVKKLPDYWYMTETVARRLALRRLELFGPPGTPEGRSKGGTISQLRRKQYPELYPNCIVGKVFAFPDRSRQLAEFVGIVLGDGGITDYQLRITLNKETEPTYIEFVAGLIKDLFGELPQKYYYSGGRREKVCNLSVGGINLIKFLQDLGLHKGNKIKQQVKVPLWVRKNISYSRACTRGLFDTDGSIYYHKHITQGYNCFNFGLTYTSYSKPILDFVYSFLLRMGFNVKQKGDSIYLYRQSEIARFFTEIGSHNQHHISRWKNYFKIKIIKQQ